MRRTEPIYVDLTLHCISSTAARFLLYRPKPKGTNPVKTRIIYYPAAPAFPRARSRPPPLALSPLAVPDLINIAQPADLDARIASQATGDETPGNAARHQLPGRPRAGPHPHLPSPSFFRRVFDARAFLFVFADVYFAGLAFSREH
ncbi:hypothetical protein HETIRDRAFT_451603 [Heterobasidion irregulare TC 32-1]|uniref:Uncharacterized protein n=1 Tax=Heterobasidion irregulare (strain TC 32-1) TaxID=747525 RepID=W4K812_HETIT|nr:uncharacterized protein HETIRDRAFT_451574 [Heterobasidion irregulare TC 32-1]XP_009546518.1 uncharacterized protein HETIRDRAFT_451603 [Heterobasidion irregulare TC 32-1]ETW81889.1 hypothetical protein HETIRDRAFT_451574 [Heterobasidion irregulare TC 32-1]ETW81928.1 hypothetical protein HETIRDRAFT_451603 [Heterobasidion irregulare TC 32-1]